MFLTMFFLAVVGAGLFPTARAEAQPRRPGAWAWKPILLHEGVRFEHLFYRAADNANKGIVVKRTNHNAYPVHDAFKVFRPGEAVRVEEVEGDLEAKEIKTGARAGLFRAPFKDGRTIGELGLRGIRITRREQNERRRDVRGSGHGASIGT